MARPHVDLTKAIWDVPMIDNCSDWKSQTQYWCMHIVSGDKYLFGALWLVCIGSLRSSILVKS